MSRRCSPWSGSNLYISPTPRPRPPKSHRVFIVFPFSLDLGARQHNQRFLVRFCNAVWVIRMRVWGGSADGHCLIQHAMPRQTTIQEGACSTEEHDRPKVASQQVEGQEPTATQREPSFEVPNIHRTLRRHEAVARTCCPRLRCRAYRFCHLRFSFSGGPLHAFPPASAWQCTPTAERAQASSQLNPALPQYNRGYQRPCAGLCVGQRARDMPDFSD